VTPCEFLENVVRPNVQDFNANYGSVRHAYNAVAAVDALAAHLYLWCKTNASSEIVDVSDDTQYRARSAQSSSDFRLLRDIAKAQKHAHLDRGAPEVTAAAQVAARSTGWGEARWDEGRWGGPPQVVVTTDGGELRYVEKIVAAALTVLETEMSRLKI
jgi:hypothetical protein